MGINEALTFDEAVVVLIWVGLAWFMATGGLIAGFVVKDAFSGGFAIWPSKLVGRLCLVIAAIFFLTAAGFILLAVLLMAYTAPFIWMMLLGTLALLLGLICRDQKRLLDSASLRSR